MFQKILDKFRKKNESINEGGMELKKLEDAIKMFKKKLKNKVGLPKMLEMRKTKNTLKD